MDMEEALQLIDRLMEHLAEDDDEDDEQAAHDRRAGLGLALVGRLALAVLASALDPAGLATAAQAAAPPALASPADPCAGAATLPPAISSAITGPTGWPQ